MCESVEYVERAATGSLVVLLRLNTEMMRQLLSVSRIAGLLPLCYDVHVM